MLRVSCGFVEVSYGNGIERGLCHPSEPIYAQPYLGPIPHALLCCGEGAGLGAGQTGPLTHFASASALMNVSLVNIWVSHKVVLKILRGNESNAALRMPIPGCLT